MSPLDIFIISLLLFITVVLSVVSGCILENQNDGTDIIFTAIGTIVFSLLLIFYVNLRMNDFVRELYMHNVPLTKQQASIVIKKNYFDINKPIIFKEENKSLKD